MWITTQEQIQDFSQYCGTTRQSHRLSYPRLETSLTPTQRGANYSDTVGSNSAGRTSPASPTLGTLMQTEPKSDSSSRIRERQVTRWSSDTSRSRGPLCGWSFMSSPSEHQTETLNTLLSAPSRCLTFTQRLAALPTLLIILGLLATWLVLCVIILGSVLSFASLHSLLLEKFHIKHSLTHSSTSSYHESR